MSKSDVFYKALLTRDDRFDGKFFVGVKTTGIYCRPICPARPKPENVEFFSDALAAEKAGYRPCLRCRPEAAPLSSAWLGKSVTVQRALKFIAANELTGGEAAFAERLGVSARHLRRLFEDEIGQTPKQIADIHRLNFACKLIVETGLPFAEIAHSSGFRSLRRFNDAFKKRFKRTPSQLRKKHPVDKESGGIELSLAYRPPFHWKNLIQYYQAHEIAGVETVTANSYERVFQINGRIGEFRLTPYKDRHALKLQIFFDDVKFLLQIVQRVRHMFDLDSDPVLLANAFEPIPGLGKIFKKHKGLRIPRGWDPFEVAVTAILGQLVSIAFATQLKKELVENYGEKIVHPVTGKVAYLFPTAKVLSQASMSEIKTTNARKEAIREFSKLVVQKKIDLSETQDPQQFRKSLLAIRGIGPWTAEYISLRAIGDTDAFPSTDLILKRALQRHPEMDLELAKPWRSYAAIYLWKEYAKMLSKKDGNNEMDL
jgi:AraC family transcriptional regulator of adaptative response / DNA-3-methyladenine glycosylase II